MKIAVFVDAGYLYALCCIARFRAPQPRVRVDLDLDAVVRQLKFEVAALDGGGGRLIRIYWYDGAPKSGMTADQARVASAADVKLRLGSVNNYGEQKGVDALIAHDLSELARNGAIEAAILVSGDEDILVGVQTAQSFGVRVHLLGIDPLHSQAQRLRHEADVCHEWPEGLVAPWLNLKPSARAYQPTTEDGAEYDYGTGALPDMEPIVDAMQPAIEGRQYALLNLWERSNRIPREIDSQLMRVLSSTLGRQLSAQEKPALRQTFIEALRARLERVPTDDTLALDETPFMEPEGDLSAEDVNPEMSAADATSGEITPESIEQIVAAMLPGIRTRIPRILENWDTTGRLPVDVNVGLLKAARDMAGSDIENRGALRASFINALRAATEAESLGDQQPATDELHEPRADDAAQTSAVDEEPHADRVLEEAEGLTIG